MLGQRSPAVNSYSNNEIKEEENGMGWAAELSSPPPPPPPLGIHGGAAGPGRPRVSALLRAEAHLESSTPAGGSFIAVSAAAAAAAASASAFPTALENERKTEGDGAEQLRE